MDQYEFSISVIIPVYNCERYIAEALESVLSQTEKPFEIIVVDSSNDSTPNILRSFSNYIRYYFQPPQGVSQARNFGVNLARGNFLAHLDGDDIWMDDKLHCQTESFREIPDLEITGGLMEPFFSPELNSQEKEKIFCPPDPLPGFSASVLVVKKEAFFRVGPYDIDLKVGLDLDWFVRAREKKLKEKMIQKVLVKRRLHKSNTDLLNKQFRNERIRVLKAALDRRRKASGDLSEK